MKKKVEIPIEVHFFTDKKGKVYLDIENVIELIDFAIAGTVCGTLDVQDLIQQLKKMQQKNEN